MQRAALIREVRQSLQILQSTQDLATLEGQRWHQTMLREIKKIDHLVDRLETELSCPLEKECPRLRGKNVQ